MTPEIPAEWWQLLVRIDERTTTISTTLADIKSSHDNLENRLRAVEDEQKVREGLKDRFVATERLAVDVEKRVAAIETKGKAGASFADWCWRVIPVAVTAIFAVATFMAGKV